MFTPTRFVLAALSLLAIAACDLTASEPDVPAELESLDLGDVSAELVLGTLPYNTPFKTRLYATGTYAYHWYFLDTQPGDSLNIVAEFNRARGFVSFAKLVGNRVSFDLCFNGAANGCQSLEVPDDGQYLVLATTANLWNFGVPTSADYKIEVSAETREVCGVRGGAICGEGEFCSFPRESICGAADGPGFCEPIPTACIEIFSPVESCDGTIYCNECYAAAWGASVVADAPPTAPGDIVCGFPGDPLPPPPLPLPGDTVCSTTNLCGENEVCDYSGLDLRECPDSYDGLQGVCRNPAASSCATIEEPVCGCDGVTYSNQCLLGLSTGVAIASQGECASN